LQLVSAANNKKGSTPTATLRGLPDLRGFYQTEFGGKPPFFGGKSLFFLIKPILLLLNEIQ